MSLTQLRAFYDDSAVAMTDAQEGGNSGHAESPHFKDQAERYASGNLRPVYFYPNDLIGHIGRSYKPGV